MGKKINIDQIDAFTNKPFHGNPAAVTFGDNLTSKEMQLIAREMNLSETAFLSKSEKADFNLRWFTPATEVDLCGHATIASLHFLTVHKIIKNNSRITFDTLSGILQCYIEDDKYFMQIPIFKVNEFEGNKDEIIDTLGIDKNGLENSIPFVIVENGYLYIYVKDLNTLKNLQPNFNAILKISETKKEFEGVVVYTRETIEPKNFAHLRFFGPYYGINEDPVTGSANGPLLLVLLKLGLLKNMKNEVELNFEQGDIINKPGRIGVRYSSVSGELFISGNAVTVLKGEMSF